VVDASQPGRLLRDRRLSARRVRAFWRLAAPAAQHERRKDDDDDEEHGRGSLDDPWALATGRRLIPGVCFPTYTGNQ
jgi:hypothetical protein